MTFPSEVLTDVNNNKNDVVYTQMEDLKCSVHVWCELTRFYKDSAFIMQKGQAHPFMYLHK